jgi:hypothetical protein
MKSTEIVYRGVRAWVEISDDGCLPDTHVVARLFMVDTVHTERSPAFSAHVRIPEETPHA